MVAFTLLEQFKGDPLENVYRLLLRDTIEVGKEYYVFMMKTYDGALLPISRNGSVIPIEDASEKLIEELYKISK